MLTALIAAAVVVQGSQAQAAPGPKPAELISKMLARYAEAKSLTGKIEYSQTAGQTSVKGQTELQYLRPDKLYVQQVFNSWRGKETYRIVSDGKRFVYNLPERLREPGHYDELTERVQQQGRNLEVRDMYGIGASGLFDKSVPLDIAIGRIDDLKIFRAQLATVNYLGQEKIDGQEAFLIGGEWKQYAEAAVSGSYKMAITDGGDLLAYSIKETVAQADAKLPPTDVVTSWKVMLTVNGNPDERLFKR